jgi:hypothetical protein
VNCCAGGFGIIASMIRMDGEQTVLSFVDEFSESIIEVFYHLKQTDSGLKFVVSATYRAPIQSGSDKGKEIFRSYDFEHRRFGYTEKDSSYLIAELDEIEFIDFLNMAKYRTIVITPLMARNAFRTYLETVRRENYRDARHIPMVPTEADIDHSALLKRLLEGHPVLPKVPPRGHSYPNYRAAEGKPWTPAEMRRLRDHVATANSKQLVIDQCDDWEIVDDLQIRHVPSNTIYKLSKPLPNWQKKVGDIMPDFFLQTEEPYEICNACDGSGIEVKGRYIGKDNKGNYQFSEKGGASCTLCGGSGKGKKVLLNERVPF